MTIGAGQATQTGVEVPFDATRLDALLEEAGVDGLLATSPHNVRYLLGGYQYFMYARMDSIGLSRYQPILGLEKGDLASAAYIGAGNEDWGTEVDPPWTPTVRNCAWGAGDAAREACRWIRDAGLESSRLGVELPYLSAEAMRILGADLPHLELIDVTEALEELRSIKRPDELEIIRDSSTAVVDAMLATFEGTAPGETKDEIYERLRLEETRRGLSFAYCLIAAGSSHNRAPSPQRLQSGQVLSLDSGAERLGYVADLTRMGIAGEPTALHDELLGEVAGVQQAARDSVKPGTSGEELFGAAARQIESSDYAPLLSFLAHGFGLVTHEAPRMTATGSPPYPAKHARRPLEAGMTLSIETHLAHPEVGFVKLEDTVVVTSEGYEAVADHGRGWNEIGD